MYALSILQTHQDLHGVPKYSPVNGAPFSSFTFLSLLHVILRYLSPPHFSKEIREKWYCYMEELSSIPGSEDQEFQCCSTLLDVYTIRM